MLQKYLIVLALPLSTAYENIALLKPAWQAHPYNNILGVAGDAVDGGKTDLSYSGGQCSASKGGFRNATWWVNLSSVLSVHHITIFHRTENTESDYRQYCAPRFLGFYVYVSNTTNRLDGHLCFHDTIYTIPTIPAVINLPCPVHGQYVIYYNERLSGTKNPPGYSSHAFNDLCEVEVYGCPVPGYYGPDCAFPCPDTNCRYCHIETGACQGCKPGYQGHQCELRCSSQYYGELCKDTCGNCSDGVTCNNVNGTCTNGCDVGVSGEKCKTPCLLGFYGMNCLERCSTNCGLPGRCNKTSGECEGGYQPGWKGILCDTKCGDNLYGPDCNQTCGTCREGKQCHHINGSCNNECEPGYRGNKCDEVCEFGYFGAKCKEECSVFCQKSRDCHHVTGYCRFGCKNGWRGKDCLEVDTQGQDTDSDRNCETRFYGVLCALCIILVLIGVYALYKFMKWNKKRLDKDKKYRASDSTICTKDTVLQVRKDENVNSGYQDLGELSSSSAYDTIH